MNFEQPPVPVAEKPKNPYEGLEGIPSDKLEEELSKLSLDQKSWLNAKLESDLEKVSKDMETIGAEVGLETTGSAEPVKGEMGLTLNELSLEKAKLIDKLEKVKDAMSKESESYKEM